MSTPASEVALIPAVKPSHGKRGSRPAGSLARIHVPQTLRAEDVARSLLRLQMRIRELEAELTALRKAPAGWR